MELAGKRAALAEMRACSELLRMYVRDLLYHVVDVPRGGTHHTENGHDERVAQDGLLHHHEQPCRYCEQALRAPQNPQPSAEMRSLVAVVTDAQGVAQITALCAAIKQAATKFSPPLANFVKRMVRVVSLSAEPGPREWRNANIAASRRSEGGPAVLRAGRGATQDG